MKTSSCFEYNDAKVTLKRTMTPMNSTYAFIHGQTPVLKTAEEEYQDGSMKSSLKALAEADKALNKQPTLDSMHVNIDNGQQQFIVSGLTRSQTLLSLSASSVSSFSESGLLQESVIQQEENKTSFGMKLRKESGLSRSQTLLSLSASSVSSFSESGLLQESVIQQEDNNTSFGMKLRKESGLSRSQTLLSLSASSVSSFSESGLLQESVIQQEENNTLIQQEENNTSFGMELRRESNSTCEVPIFDKGMRRTMEPFLRKARIQREEARNRTNVRFLSSIGSNSGVPYIALRSERSFLFDVETHPIHRVLAETLGVQNLSKLHEVPDLQKLMSPLRSRSRRRMFQQCYDDFVTSFCIPLLHSIAMSKNMFHSTSPDSSISYRYQAFPNVRVVRPEETSDGPRCDTDKGHSIGCLHFHVPLTPSCGTNALYIESYPGKEDWHPLLSKSVGLGFLFDGARCLHFDLANTTSSTSVTLDFVITFYEDGIKRDYVDGDCLCDKAVLEDDFSRAGGYYDEATIDMCLRSHFGQMVATKHGSHHLLDPDHRVGFPFV
jgi:hypothetical protein